MENIEILSYNRCVCGAITLETNVGTYSCQEANLRQFFPNIDLRNHKSVRGKHIWGNCNYCVNHYGLDLCSCGSGEKVGECECGSKTPMQVVGEYDRVVDGNSPFVS